MQFVDIKNDNLIPENLNDEGLKEAYEYANKNTWSKEELDAYNYAAMREQDEKGRLEKAVQQAEEKKDIEAVLGLIKIGLDKIKIAEALNITPEKVQQIIDNQKV